MSGPEAQPNTQPNEQAVGPTRDGRLAALILGISFLPIGLQAAFTPRSFFDDFPIGRGWISLGGELYNEHLVRDVGGLFLVLSLLSVWAWRNRALAQPLLVAWLVEGTLHVWFHVRHLGHFDGADRAALILTLGSTPVVAVVGLVAARSKTRS